jgi:hypothetical protein
MVIVLCDAAMPADRPKPTTVVSSIFFNDIIVQIFTYIKILESPCSSQAQFSGSIIAAAQRQLESGGFTQF